MNGLEAVQAVKDGKRVQYSDGDGTWESFDLTTNMASERITGDD